MLGMLFVFGGFVFHPCSATVALMIVTAVI